MNLSVLAILNHPHAHLWYLLSLLSSSLLSISASHLPSLLYPSASKSDISFTLILLCSLSLYFHPPFHRSLSTKRISLHSINLHGISPQGFVSCVSLFPENRALSSLLLWDAFLLPGWVDRVSPKNGHWKVLEGWDKTGEGGLGGSDNKLGICMWALTYRLCNPSS